MPGAVPGAFPTAVPGAVPGALPALPAGVLPAGVLPAGVLPAGILPAGAGFLTFTPPPLARAMVPSAPPIPVGYDFKPMWPTTTAFADGQSVVSATGRGPGAFSVAGGLPAMRSGRRN